VNPLKLIGMKYRLGADPAKHGAVDCLSLCQTVLASYGLTAPQAERSWYRRLRKEDYSVFPEQLKLWGKEILEPRIGTVALCRSENGGYGLAVYWEYGWLSISEARVVKWSPAIALDCVGLYCQ